ncbi:MAG: alanine--glyoxylate aminotransferase family protein [Rhodobacteraceae bacterium]|jgi:aspartate aminotransferase-like enzyme|nr:alanine--glyoxylate aminotransferase family protein [Paracoccaceae bacterium]MBT4284328.1 alanine--glyoxylate aminotransferase family protein [Paracoccaceae bacterium]MBT6270814.1 alanine--glyoxylate aminotransferase family protein [Paracoccaceae bacterium]MBT6437218.1 alanine--glyoxylate aminotransferase family protein [Paracoccaceae bacterium]|tara:strand:+ start:2685 stop:3818 length:1134 start_codon:yes stop_codon:yes gene_type:complete
MVISHSNVDPNGLKEFSVVFTDRSLNHMSDLFGGVMNDISSTLKEVYKANSIALVPGGGTFAMESVARQFMSGKTALVVRNGWFSYRWSQIFETGNICSSVIVMKAKQFGNNLQSSFEPAPIDEVVAKIKSEKPDFVFAPHVETSAGIILPDNYIRELSKAAHSVNALMVLDCIASGCVWIDMEDTGVDILISAPQKGWSSQPCAGLVMMSTNAREKINTTDSDSFAMDLKKWLSIMETYEAGGHAYHATMPTDSLKVFRDTLSETREFGFSTAFDAQWKLGKSVRKSLKNWGIQSVAADGFGAPGVVVSYTDSSDIQNGSRFKELGFQIAAGVPLKCDEPPGFSTFRLGLFGLDKLKNIESTLLTLDQAFEQIFTP